MAFVHWKTIFKHLFIHSFIHSLTRLCLLMGKRKLFPLCIYMSKTERREESVKSAYWLRRRQWRQRETNAENVLFLSFSLSLSFSHACLLDILLRLLFFLFFLLYFCLLIAYRRSSSSTICCYDDAFPRVSLNIYKDSEIKENKKSNFNVHAYDSLLLFLLLRHQKQREQFRMMYRCKKRKRN